MLSGEVTTRKELPLLNETLCFKVLTLRNGSHRLTKQAGGLTMSAMQSGVSGPYGLPVTEPEKVGFSSGRLKRIGPSMQKYIDSRMIPGVLTVVARHGQIVHFETRGLMDIEAGKPMAGNTIFRIMSMTKPISCVGLMMLYEEGHFLLNQPISAFLPSFRNMMVKGRRGLLEPASREINFRDCMTHTAGFSSQEWGKCIPRSSSSPVQPLVPGTKGQTVNQPGEPGTLQEAVEMFSKAPLNYHPGTDWEYHPGHEVVGALIEKISGQSLDKFLQERILDPLKMVDTHFYLPKEKVGRLAALYTVIQNQWGNIGLIDCPATSAKVLGPKTFFSSGGGMLSTAADYARFAQMLLNGGELDGTRIISRKTIELMTANHTGDFNIYPEGPGYGYGLGFSVRLSLTATPLIGSVGAYGWNGAHITYYLADPKEDLFCLMFTQVANAQPTGQHRSMRADFDRMVYQALI
jgi:CubicO group peptidase (beta-lactamase class C family)